MKWPPLFSECSFGNSDPSFFYDRILIIEDVSPVCSIDYEQKSIGDFTLFLGLLPKKARSGFYRDIIAGFVQRDGFIGTVRRTYATANAKTPIDHDPFTGIVLAEGQHFNGTHINTGFAQITIVMVNHRFEIGLSESTLIP
jgi:hypothetical protein